MLSFCRLLLALAMMPAGVGASIAEPSPLRDRIGAWRTIVRPAVAHALEGIASYYWQEQMTASGERFDKTALTAAHPTLPFNSLVRVTDRATGDSVVVRINDRGPFTPGRVIDLSEKAAEIIGLKGRGLAPVDLEVLAVPAR
jgi:rare lipoprotein A